VLFALICVHLRLSFLLGVTALQLDLDLQVATEAPDLPVAADFARWAAAALEGRRERAALTIRIVDPAEGQALNLRFRGAGPADQCPVVPL
jgi:hypothetical protein